MRCKACRHKMMPDQARRKLAPEDRVDVRSHRGRGLCSACYTDAHRTDTLLDNEPGTMRSDALLEEATILATERGMAYRDLPDRLGMKREAFTLAVRRACLRGDQRALALAALNTYPTKGAAA